MQKPSNYDSTQISGDFIPVELGGHTAVIKRVEETTSRTGKPMIKVAFDFDDKDKQPGYFMAAFKNDTREEKKWPYQATQYIMAEDQNGSCSRSLKTFISNVEKSNGCECVWGDGFSKWFTGKKVGVVFGNVEEEYNGEVKMRRRMRWFCQYNNAKDASIPADKLLPAQASPSGYVNIPDGTNEEIPF